MYSSGNTTTHLTSRVREIRITPTVIRPARVVLETELLSGEHVTAECGGLLGRCIQHELDHLDGVVFADRVAPDDRKFIEAELRKLEKYGSKHHYQRVTTVRR